MRSDLTVNGRQARKVSSVFRPRHFWVKLCKEYKRSDLSQKQFSVSQGVPYSTFYSWLTRLELEGALQVGVFVQVDVDETMLSLEPIGAGLADQNATSLASIYMESHAANPTSNKAKCLTEVSSELKLTFGPGLILSIPKGFDVLTLRQVVEALSPC